MTIDAATSEAPPESSAPGEHPNQFALLTQRRFGPFFWTQFLGAGNDNLFKFAFTVMVTYQIQVSWLPTELAGLVIGALFILPFLLFSATSGQLADKFEKSALIRFVKWLEIAIMAIAAFGFVTAANVAFDDHPNEKRFGDRIETVTVDSVFAWLNRSSLGGPVQVIR